MDIVRFDAQQRVDLPDMTAVSFLVLGEFRRTMRFLAGEEAAKIIKGFEVEPESPVSTRVVVKLDNTPSPQLSQALLPENPGTLEFGQLTGGKGPTGAEEGQAQQILDFNGQPAGAYTVEMRFVPYTTSTGDSDNRAFWNPGVNSEFITATDTRFKAQWQVQYVLGGGTGGEWLALATVNFAGGASTISSGDITDVREFLFEGTAGAFDATTQAGPGGMPDFDRSAGREGLAVGLNEVYPILRALGRQVQDLKGQNDAGNFNWYARVFRPFDDTNSTLPATQTKSLRSVDTVTYTVGDGVTTFGDFNGTSGLNDCLVHLANLGNQVPGHVRVVVKSDGSPMVAQELTAQAILDDSFHLELIGRGEGTGGLGKVRMRVPVSIDPGLSVTPIVFGSNNFGKLTIRNFEFRNAPANNISVVFCANAALDMDSCTIRGHEAAGASSAQALNFFCQGSRITNSELRGRIRITGVDTNGSDEDREGCLIENVFINNGCIECHTDLFEQVRGLTIRNCRIEMNEAHGWGLRGAIDGADCARLRVENCDIVHAGDVDGVHYRRVNNGGSHWQIIDTRIASTAGAHVVGAGANGAKGTGWSVFVDGTNSAPFVGLVVRGLRCLGTTAVDAGGIYTHQCRDFNISECDWQFAAHQTGGAGNQTYTAIYIDGFSNNFDSQGVISGCSMHRWNGFGGGVRTRGIRTENCDNIKIIGNHIVGSDDLGGAITGRGTSDVACRLEDGWYIGIHNNHFEQWEEATTADRCVTISGDVRYLKVDHNTFRNNGGHCIDLVGADYCTVIGNTIHVDDATALGIDVGTAVDAVVNDNMIHFQGGARVGIEWGSASNGMCSGNRGRNATINVSSGSVWGVNTGPTNLNYIT